MQMDATELFNNLEGRVDFWRALRSARALQLNWAARQ